MRVAIIGAGPSGLVAAKTLAERGHTPVVFESESKIGGAFRYKAYENCSLVSSKYITAFSDFRMPNDANLHPSLPEYVQYLENYARHFNIHRFIQFDSLVASVHRKANCCEGIQYVVTVNGHQMVFDAVAVCSGLHNIPHMPTQPLAGFDGKVIHSSEYKNSNVFRDKNVLIVGTGETGMDLAYHAVCVTQKR